MPERTVVMLAVLVVICVAFGVALLLRERRLGRQRQEFADAQRACIDEMIKAKRQKGLS